MPSSLAHCHATTVVYWGAVGFDDAQPPPHVPVAHDGALANQELEHLRIMCPREARLRVY